MSQIVVQFCPCGHVATLPLQTVLQMGGKRQLVDTKKLEHPIFPTSECVECQQESEYQNRLLNNLYADWPDLDDEF